MITFEDVYQFLKDNYLHSRFEGNNINWPNGVPEGGSYSELVARNCLDRLLTEGKDNISHFESRSGKPIHFNDKLEILNPDSPPIEIKHKSSSLTNANGNW